MSPAATTRVWYPARRGTGTGPPIYLADKTAAAYGLPAKQLKGVVPRASVNAEPAPTTEGVGRGRAHAGLGHPDGVVDRARTGPREQRLRRRDRRPDVRHRRPEHAAGRHRRPGSAAGPDRGGNRFRDRAETSRRSPDPSTRSKIAVGGHSIAGAIAFQAGLTDPRVHAVFDLDGWLHGPALETPVTVPALMVDASGLDAATKAVIGRTATAVTVQARGCDAPRRHRPPVPRTRPRTNRTRASDSAPSGARAQRPPTPWSCGSSTWSSETASRRRLQRG